MRVGGVSGGDGNLSISFAPATAIDLSSIHLSLVVGKKVHLNEALKTDVVILKTVRKCLF